MSRSWLLLLALSLTVGCPNPGDDDDATGDDDDSTPPDDDDDDSTPIPSDPCAADDASAAVGGSVTGSTVGGTDDLLGTCSAGQIADDIWVLEDAQPGTYTVTTVSDLTTFDTVVFAYTDCTNPFGSELDCNDDTTQDLLQSTIQFDLQAAQDVFLVVEGYDGEGSYELLIDRAVCGDGEVGGSEQCDGGADCDSNCAWLCTDDAREDDDDPTLATAVAGGSQVFDDGVLCPVDAETDKALAGLAVDAFAVTLDDADAYVEASLAPGGTLSTDCADLAVGFGVSDAEYNLIAENDAAEGACPHVAAVPGAGTWYLLIYRGDVTLPPMDYELTVTSGVSECGDDVREGIEECDDGNLDGEDGCSAECRVEDATCPVTADITASLDGAHTTGDTSTSSDAHTPSCSASASADLVYELTFTEDTVVGISTDHAGTDFDTVLSVREASCVDPGQEIACNDDVDGFGGNYNSEVGLRAQAGVTYYVIVDGYQAEAGGFELSVTESVCQNGEVEPGEECDDDNDLNGDGCEDDCTATPMCAMEKDGNLGSLAGGNDATWTGDVGEDTDNLPPITCSAPGGGDRVFGFSVPDGLLTLTFDHTGGDVQYAIFAANDACEETQCIDSYPAEAGEQTFSVSAGNYLLVLEAYDAATTSATTTFTLSYSD